MRDVRAVQWLPLDQAIKKLTHAREQVFLANVGPSALEASEQPGEHVAADHVAERMTCSQDSGHGSKGGADSTASAAKPVRREKCDHQVLHF